MPVTSIHPKSVVAFTWARAWSLTALTTCGLLVVAAEWGADVSAVRHGTWTGLSGSISPADGPFVIDERAGGEGTCMMRGQSSSSSGNGWVFRGNTTVQETACALRIAKGGATTGELTLRIEWHGRMKGIGGDDWDDVDGYGDCTGQLVGSHGGKGTWQGVCVNERHRWNQRFDWTVDSD